MEGTTERTTKTCQRCGRQGKNAFRRLVLADRAVGWVCSHSETCTARTRLRARRQYRSGEPTQHELPWIEKPVCVIGSDPDETTLVGQVLEELAGLDVDVLGADARSLARMIARDYGCVVVSCSWSDGAGYLSDLARRLRTMGRRAIPIVVCHTAGAMSPSTADLILRTGAHPIARPFDANDLIDTVGRAAAGQAPSAPVWVAIPVEDETPVRPTAC